MTGTGERWPYWLSAFSVALSLAELAYNAAKGPARYVQFTVGSTTWTGAGKTQDYVLLVVLVAAFAGIWWGLLALERRVEPLGPGAVQDMRALFTYASFPVIVWAAGLVLGPATAPRDLVWLGSIGVLLSIGLTWLSTRPRLDHAGPLAFEGAGLVLLLTASGALSALLAAFAINRWSALRAHALVWDATFPALWFAGAGALLGLFVGLTGWTRRDVRAGLFNSLLAGQVALPLGFLAVIPTPWAVGTVISFGIPTRRVVSLAIALMVLAYVDLVRRLRRAYRQDRSELNPLDALSPVALAAALFYIKLNPIYVGSLDPDDYHFGEMLLPWWSLATHHAVPFWDYVPARGLSDYVWGATSAAFYNGTAAGVIAALPTIVALVILAGVVALSGVIGVLPASAAFLLIPTWHTLSQIDIVNTVGFAVLCLTFLRARPAVGFVTWCGIAPLVFLWAPAQGSALVIATMPIALWQGLVALRQSRAELLTWISGLVCAAILLIVATPVGRMTMGAVRYALEHSAVGGPAHGIDWEHSLSMTLSLNRWLWEAVRTSWIGVGLVAAAALIASRRKLDDPQKRPLLVIGIPVVILAVVFIYRAAGRIGPDVSRLGYASVWMNTLLLPMVLYAVWGRRRWPATLALTLAAGGLLAPALAPVPLRATANRVYHALQPPPNVREPSGFRNIGMATLPREQMARLAAIRKVLQIGLDPGETYLDLTNRNAQTFYLGFMPPLETGALYNLPNDAQQLRAIDALTRKGVPMVLASGAAELWDGGPQSYRTYAIYRYLLWHYVPAKIEGLIFLVTPERLQRLKARPEVAVEDSDPAGLLDAVFRLEDLQGLPSAWGASWSSLEQAATLVRQLESHSTSSGPPSIGWNLSPPLAGKDAGVLAFDFDCAGATGIVPLEVTWTSASEPPDPAALILFRSGRRVAVPLDAAPRWLRSQPTTLYVSLTEPAACTSIAVQNVGLWQRRIVASTDPAQR